MRDYSLVSPGPMLSALFLILPVLAVPAVVKGRLYATPLPLLVFLATLAALLGLLHSLQAQQIVLALLSATLGGSILHLQFFLPNAGPSILILPGIFLICATLLSIAPHHAHMAPFVGLAFVLTTVGTSVFVFVCRDPRDPTPHLVNQTETLYFPPTYTEKPTKTLSSTGCISSSDTESLTFIASPTRNHNLPTVYFFILISIQLAYTAAVVFTIPAALLSPPSRPLVPSIVGHPFPDRVDVFWILQETFFLLSLLCVVAAYYFRSKPRPPSSSSIRVHTAGIPPSSTLTLSTSSQPSSSPGLEQNSSSNNHAVASKTKVGGLYVPLAINTTSTSLNTPISPVLSLPPRPKSVHHIQRHQQRRQEQLEQSKNWSASWACPSTHTRSMYAHNLDIRHVGMLDCTNLEDPFAPPPPPPLSQTSPTSTSTKMRRNANINTSAYRVAKKHQQQQQIYQVSRPGKRMNAWGRLTLPLPLPLPLSLGSTYPHPCASRTSTSTRKARRKKKGLEHDSVSTSGLFKTRVRAKEVGETSIGLGTVIEDALIAQRLLIQLGGGMKNEK